MRVLLFIRHSREGGSPVRAGVWIPAYAGMTGVIDDQYLFFRHSRECESFCFSVTPANVSPFFSPSLPRRRESSAGRGLDSRLRGNDEGH